MGRQRTTRTPIPGLPGVALIATQQQHQTTFDLEVKRDDCVDFALDLSACDCEVLGADGARVLRTISTRGTTALGTAAGTALRPRFELGQKLI